MDWWVENQLRAALLTDLRDLVPDGYFEQEGNQLKINSSLDKSGHLSKELSWGYAAGKLGHSLYFKNTKIISPRQLAAAEVLMHLGMLVSTKASHEACSNLKDRADVLHVNDGNAGKVSLQIKAEHLPQLEKNLNGGLIQYLKHLSKEEASPYVSLLKDDGLIELGLKERLRDKVIRKLIENIVAVIVSVISVVITAAVVVWLGLN